MTRLAVVSSIAVYDGRTHLGDVAELGNGQFRASDRDGKQLGPLLDKLDDARNVILRRCQPAGDDHARA